MARSPAGAAMFDWNVIVTARDAEGYRAARRALRAFGRVERTAFYNVLALRVADVGEFLATLVARIAEDKTLLNDVARILPAQVVFDFTTPNEFLARARETVLRWAECLAGRRFHARFTRRGRRRELPSLEVERFLNDAILAATAGLGRPAHIDFTDPDYVIDVETLADRAGISLWSREDLMRAPFLKID